MSLPSHTVSATVSLQDIFHPCPRGFLWRDSKYAYKEQHYLRSRKWRFSVSVRRSIVSFVSSTSALEVEQEFVSGASALLGYYEALNGSCVPTFRESVSVPSSKVFDCFTVEDEAYQSLWKMRPIRCPETSVTKHQRCVTSQKREGLILTTAEAWNHPKLSLLC